MNSQDSVFSYNRFDYESHLRKGIEMAKVQGLDAHAYIKELPFSTDEYESRLAGVRERMNDAKHDAIIVTSPENIYYLSGFHHGGYFYPQFLIVPASGDPFFIIRSTEEPNILALSWIERAVTYMDHEDPSEHIASAIRDAGLAKARLGVDRNSWFIPIALYERIVASLPGARFGDGSMIVERGRLIKSESELAYIHQAARCAEAGMQAGIQAIHEGANENEVAAEMQRVPTLMGSEYPSCAPWVSSGPRASLPHQTWASRRIERGDPIYLEVSGCVKRYSAAMMRTVVVGEPSVELQRMSDAGQRAHERMLAAIRPGPRVEEIWQVWADSLLEAGYQGGFKRCGYSIGINFPPGWGEGNIVSWRRGEKTRVQANMTFHTTSMVKVFGVADVSTSTTIRVTENGYEPVTQFEQRLFVR